MADLTVPCTPTQYLPEQRLLPENRTPLETNVVITEDRTADVPVPYRELMNPWKCPVDFLPWLAASWGVDLWYPDWDEMRKRSIIANIVTLKRLKGTLAGIKMYLSYVDGIVVYSVTPPAKGFYRAGFTAAQRLAFVNSLPYIQIFDYEEQRQAPTWRAFAVPTGDTLRRKFFYGNSFYQASAGPTLYGRKAQFADPLQPTVPPAPVTYTSFLDPTTSNVVQQMFIAFTGSKRAFMGHIFGVSNASTGTYRKFMQASRAASNMVSVTLDPNASQLYATFSGDQTYTVKPQPVFQQRVPLSRAFMGRSFYGSYGLRSGYMRTSYAPRLIYDKLSIYDPSRLPVAQRNARSFYNHARFGIGAYNAELTVTFPMFRPRFRQAKYYGRGFLGTWNIEPLYRVLDAVHIAKSGRDKILIQPQTHQDVRLASNLHLGQFNLGQLVSTIP